ncbi:MAG: hypothetical protein C0401_03135 [Anaerolinea sp.]|nr:hypothetical protein [Anaerolinea sp.]
MDQTHWEIWARTLQQKQLTGLALTLLEGAGPIKLIFSQILLSCTPFVGQYQSGSWQSFAQMLEDQAECQSFASFLREEKNF